MRAMKRLACLLLLVGASGCSCEAGLGEKCDDRDDCTGDLLCVEGRCAEEPEDAPPDGGVDGAAPEPTTIDEVPVDEEIELVGLQAPVDVIVDAHGIPHVF